MQSRVVTVVVAALGLAATALVVGVEAVRFAYRAPTLHAVLETAEAAVALFVLYLLVGRFRAGGRPGDLLLIASLGLLATANLALSALPTALSQPARASARAWTPVVVRLLGAGVFAAAGLVPDRRLRRPRAAAVAAAAVTAAVLLAIVAGLAALTPLLPAASIGPQPEVSQRPFLSGHPVLLGAQLAGVACFAVGAAGFWRRAGRTGDALQGWLGAAAVLFAFSRLHYFLFPSLYSSFLYSGDVLRLGGYLLLAVGAVDEIRGYWARAAEAAVLQERRRIARDLHDGLAQELAFILAQARRLARRERHGQEEDAIAAAAERALDESRRAIAVLSQVGDHPLDALLAQAAEEVAGRLGVRVRLELASDVQVAGPVREALVRIVREAVTNAARHGAAEVVTVRLSKADGVTLAVSDDGAGFDPSAGGRQGGFGLTSMRERAETVGGRFRLDSAPGRGTRVEVVVG